MWRALDRTGDKWRKQWLLAALGALTALALATWYFHVLIIAAQIVALVVNPRGWRGRLAALAAGVAVQLPWAIVAVGPLVAKVSAGVTVSGQAPVAVSLQAVLIDLGTSFAGGLPTPVGGIAAGAAWLLLIAWGIARMDGEPGASRGWAFVAFVGISGWPAGGLRSGVPVGRTIAPGPLWTGYSSLGGAGPGVGARKRLVGSTPSGEYRAVGRRHGARSERSGISIERSGSARRSAPSPARPGDGPNGTTCRQRPPCRRLPSSRSRPSSSSVRRRTISRWNSSKEIP